MSRRVTIPRSRDRQASTEAAARADRVVKIGLSVTLLTVLAQAASQIVDFGFYDLRIGALNSNLHSSVFGIASLLAQAAAAIALARMAARSRHRGGWLLVAALIAGLLLTRIFVAYDAVLLIPPTGLVFVLCWRLSAAEAGHTRSLIRAGLCLLALSFIVHAGGPKVVSALGYDGTSWAYQIKGIVKHATELGGWALLAIGAAVASKPTHRPGSRAPQTERIGLPSPPDRSFNTGLQAHPD
jgi:hypothetical protein